MASRQTQTTIIPPNLVLNGELKVEGNLEFATDFQGRVQSGGEVYLHPGVRLESDVTSESLRLGSGASLKGMLQVGEARKPFSRWWNWARRWGVEKSALKVRETAS